LPDEGGPGQAHLAGPASSADTIAPMAESHQSDRSPATTTSTWSASLDRVCLDAVDETRRILTALRELLTRDLQARQRSDRVRDAAEAVTTARAAHRRMSGAVALLIERAAAHGASATDLGINPPELD
jgi:hypothetical protein